MHAGHVGAQNKIADIYCQDIGLMFEHLQPAIAAADILGIVFDRHCVELQNVCDKHFCNTNVFFLSVIHSAQLHIM